MREPLRPRWSVNLGLGLVIGLVLSVLSAILLELRAGAMRRAGQV